MKIKDTELEYTEADAIVLDFFLGGESETKDQWAQRVWLKCSEYRQTDGKGHAGNGMPPVYARSPVELWEEKKRRRRASFYKAIPQANKKKLNEDFTRTAAVRADFKKLRECCYPPEIADSAILELKKHSSYITRKEAYERENFIKIT